MLAHAALGQALSAFAATPRKASFFDESQMRTLRVLVDEILPATDSPAASSADTHFFMDSALPLCASSRAQATFREGLAALMSGDFVQKEPAARVAMLRDCAARDLPRPYDDSFFRILKDYTLTGYFLSEIGATQALAYEKVPGGYWGDLPLAPGQKAWAL